jgi:hypothetical protein
MAKRTYLLPDKLLAEFEQEIAPGKRGAVVAEALRAWLDEKQRTALRAAVIEGCRDMAEVDRSIETQWAPVADKAWRAVDDELWDWDNENQPSSKSRKPRVSKSGHKDKEYQRERITA